MSALAETPCCFDRRPSRQAQRGCAGGGAGARRRQQHRDRRDRRHHRPGSRARQKPRHTADLGDDVRAVVRHGADGLAGAHLRPPHRAADRHRCRRDRPGSSAAPPFCRDRLRCCWSARSAAASMRRATCPTASPQPTRRATPTSRSRSPTCWRAVSLAGVIGPSIVIFTKDLWPPYLFAATFVAQSVLAVLAGLVLIAVQVTAADAARADRPWAGRWARSCASRNSSWPCSSAWRATR